jgi:hypothetical protein
MTMMSSLRLRVPIGAALLTATFLLFLARPVHAQSERLRATIPFSFYAGETLLPAGDYKVESLESGVVRLFNRDTHTSAIFHTMDLRHPVRERASGELIFNTYGQDHVLSELWWTGRDDGRKTLPSKFEHQLAKALIPVRIAITKR